ncbi:MAG: AAA family ATPase [Gemmatimonadota bacterium]
MDLTSSTTARYRIRLLGRPALLDDKGHPIGTVAPGKNLALLCYLAISGEASREQLVGLLWGEMEEARARNAFRQALHRLRQGAPGLIRADGERLGLEADQILVDVRAFENAVTGQQLEQAAQLYTGDLLEDTDVSEPSFGYWCESERARLRGKYHGVLVQLCEEALIAGRNDAALKWAQTFSARAPFEPTAAILESRALAAGGRRMEAASTLATFSDRIRRELGLTEPPQISEALARLNASTPWYKPVRGGSDVEAMATRSTPSTVIGREDEIAVLRDAWRTAREGVAGAICVAGPEGIGKTALLREFETRVGALEHALFCWGWEPPRQAVPFAGILDALRPLTRAPGVGGASEHLLAEAARLLPELRDRFRLPSVAPAVDQTAQLRLFEGVAAMVEAVAYEQPVCLVLEQADHSSEATLDLVRYLGMRLAGSAVLLVLTFESEAVAERWSQQLEIAGRNAVPLLRLEAMRAEQLREIAASWGLPLLAADDQNRILTLANGLPGQVQKLIRWHAEGRSLSAAPIEMAAVWRARLASCGAVERRLFAAAALIGRPAPLRLLAAAAHVPENSVLAVGLSLENLGLFVQSGAGYLVVGLQPIELVRAVLGDAPVVLLAGWVAEALEYQHEASPAELARLYQLANRPVDAFRSLRAAADDAIAIGARESAIKFLEAALPLARDRGERAAIDLLLRALRQQPHRALAGSTAADVAGSARALLRNKTVLATVVATLVLIAIPLVLTRMGQRVSIGAVMLRDTLLLNSAGNDRIADLMITGELAAGAARASAQGAATLPWVNPLGSPLGAYVALERITPEGTDVYLVDVERGDTLRFVTGGSDDFALGWSPDEQWLLVSRTRNSAATEYDVDLYAYPVARDQSPVALDTSATRTVVEAAWSPLGTRVAWVAQSGTPQQRDVFVANADGSGVMNVSQSTADDYHIAWPPQADRIAFTSTRFGNAELVVRELATGNLTRLTVNPGGDDFLHFSPDGRYAAFESTRDNRSGIFVMPALGGPATMVSGTSAQTAVVGWRGTSPRYVQDVRLVTRTLDSATTELRAELLDPARDVIPAREPVQFALSPGTSARLVSTQDPATALLVNSQSTLETVSVTAGGWRSSTLPVLTGSAPATPLDDSFEGTLDPARWLAFGEPASATSAGRGVDGSGALIFNADRQWESGVLSRHVLPIRPGMEIEATLTAADPGAARVARIAVALVAPEPASVQSNVAPQFLRLASILWLTEANRVAYSVHRELWSEPTAALPPATYQRFRIRVGGDGSVVFMVNETIRWRSTLRLHNQYGGAQLWLGGIATGSAFGVDDVRVRYAN